MARCLNTKCNFKHGFFTCDLPVDNVQVSGVWILNGESTPGKRTDIKELKGIRHGPNTVTTQDVSLTL